MDGEQGPGEPARGEQRDPLPPLPFKGPTGLWTTGERI